MNSDFIADRPHYPTTLIELDPTQDYFWAMGASAVDYLRPSEFWENSLFNNAKLKTCPIPASR